MNDKRLTVYWGEELGRYRFGEDHPLGQDRLTAFRVAAIREGIDRSSEIATPVACNVIDLILFHEPEYVQRVKEQSTIGQGYLDCGDTPAYPGIYDAGRFVVGTGLAAINRILKHDWHHAFVPIGGLHHARRDSAAGFSVFNDCGIVIEALRQRYGITRVAYVDIDAHHGDGVYYAFEEDPDLAIADIHEDGRYLYPGTGAANEEGKGIARGTKLNIPLAPGSNDSDFLRAWSRVEALVEDHKPEFIIFQAGVDSMIGDPLTHLRFSVAAHIHATRRLVELTNKYAKGRLLVYGGGGYNLDNVANGWCAVCKELV
jgi:acetoin utilization protein AcuC|tara:strand:- start:1071 stop:2015 length:945 start_codon:yes stop_codon:yes gene_type:complete